MRVGFLGPSGTFAEEALRSSAPAGVEEEVPYPSVWDTVMAVQERSVDQGVVPIENSLEGSVTTTLDALAGEASGVRIVAEVVRPISHCLVARDGVALDDVTRVLSHPQALAQCARFLHARLPRAGTEVSGSTADAVRTAVASQEPLAAIGTRLAAELYGGVVLAEGVEDRPDNLTRFVWLAPEGTPPHEPPDKTSVVFWGFNDESPGALVAVLRELADRGVNLTKIESRPRRVQLGHYMFFADLDGAADDAAVGQALAGLARRVETLRVLGSYRAARH
ncbi:MAG: prephenate dehydratase [Thermoleophilaceae bacterium]|nr:prephenate dehydratase [Thermoleophilaceae bacterium]